MIHPNWWIHHPTVPLPPTFNNGMEVDLQGSLRTTWEAMRIYGEIALIAARPAGKVQVYYRLKAGLTTAYRWITGGRKCGGLSGGFLRKPGVPQLQVRFGFVRAAFSYRFLPLALFRRLGETKLPDRRKGDGRTRARPAPRCPT